MKHIKFEENIEADASYKSNLNKKYTNLVNKIATRSPDDEYEATETKKWFQEMPEEPVNFEPSGEEQVSTLRKEATSILHGQSLAYETKIERSGSSDQKWARSLLSKGAMADKVAAATILIQDNPIFHLNTLRNLVSMVKPAKKKDSLTVIETLSELFLFDLLLPEAKLRPFNTRPLSKLNEMCSGNRDFRRKILMNWIFEDQLKEIYAEFVKSLNNFAHDTIEMHKEKAVTAMSKLLMHNPEQEKVLLISVINKLGDPSQKVASKVIYHLCQVLYNHPNMKGVVLDEIEKMLFRANISPRAQYYGICFLNQFYLTKDDNLIAESLVRVYFSFFRACIKKGDIDNRLMSAILTGVKRCQPFLGSQKLEELQEQADALYKLVHLARYNVSIHALALLFQIAPLNTQLHDRYYCALYKKLADPETLTTTLPALMMNLIYRSIKVDKCNSRVLAFLKRLLQLTMMSDAPRACAFLLLIARLVRSRKLPKVWTAKPPAEANAEIKKEVEINNDELNETVKLEEHEDSTKNQKLILRDDSRKKLLWNGDKTDLLADDEEVYNDIILEDDEEDHKRKLKKLENYTKSTSQGWVHYSSDKNKTQEIVKQEPVEDGANIDNKEKDKQLKILIKKTKNMEKVINEYLPFNRNPAYCGAENSVVSELVQLANHYHPTVRLFTEKIIEGSFIQYNGDPLKDFSISRFLERFVFKNPKKDPTKSDDKTDLRFQTVKGSHPKFAQRKNYTPGGLKSLAVNSAAYLNEDSSHIPVDERFLYDYLQIRRVKKEDESDAESDVDSVDSDEFENYLDSLTGKKTKEESESEDETIENTGIDFMEEVLKNSQEKGGAVKKKKTDEEILENDDDDEISDDGGNLDSEGDDEIDDEDHSLSMDDSDLEFSDDEDFKPKRKKSDFELSNDEDSDGFDVPQKLQKKTNKKNIKKNNSPFAYAEEFATLLEETGTSKGHGTSQAVSNTENAHQKQLDWEANRDRWIKGFRKPKHSQARKENKTFKNMKRKHNYPSKNIKHKRK